MPAVLRTAGIRRRRLLYRQVRRLERPYRGGWRHCLLIPVAVAAVLLATWLSQCGWQCLRDVVFGALATATVGFVTFWWYQRRRGAALHARRRLVESSTSCAEERTLQNILQAQDAMGKHELIELLERTSDRLREQLRDDQAQSQVWDAWERERDRLLDNMRLDLWRDRLFGEVSFGAEGDLELEPPTSDILVEWPRLMAVARKARELDRWALLHACLRTVEAAIAPCFYVDKGMLPGLCELLALETAPEHQLCLGLIHYWQVLRYERRCSAPDGERCVGCPKRRPDEEVQPRLPVETAIGEIALPDVTQPVDEIFAHE